MITIGVTGTKGKTTTVQIIERVFLSSNINTYSLYGISGVDFTSFYNGKPVLKNNKRKVDVYEWNHNTMPAQIQITEATSHRLNVGSYKNYEFNIGIFTSYESNEHSHLHGDDQKYLASKKKIFNQLKKDFQPDFRQSGQAIVCRDIERYEDIVDGVTSNMTTYGEHEESDYRIKIESIGEEFMNFSITHKEETIPFVTPLKGLMNAKNFTAAYIACKMLNVPDQFLQACFKTFSSPAGRMNHYHIPERDLDIIIDYAHTKQSLESLLLTAKQMFLDKEVKLLFGCGGNRSKEKRKFMGAVADQHSDQIYLTNDNPRREKPLNIVKDIQKGITHSEKVFIIPDRTQAIKTILSDSYNSVLILAGKGVEETIEYNNLKFSHSDKKDVIDWCLANQYSIIEVGAQAKGYSSKSTTRF